MRRGPASILTVILFATAGAFAQHPAFEVASIKENQSGRDGGYFRFLPDGSGVRAEHFSAVSLLTLAFDVRRFQLVGVPGWTRSTFYDILARPERTATRDELNAMLRGLLVERFKLAFHRTSHEVDGFVLQRVRADRLGPGWQISSIDCSTREFAGTPRCREGGMTSGEWKQNGVPVWSLVQFLTGEINAPVEDQSGLTGTFDLDFRWSNEIAPSGDLPSIYTAVQEQLGLTLERHKVTIDGFVIDRFERADPD